MKALLKSGIYILALCLLIQATYAFTVTNPSLPAQDIQPGQQVTAHVTVEFPTTGTGVFPMEDDLQFGTDLYSPKWTFQIEKDGITEPATTERIKYPRIDGFLLAPTQKGGTSFKLLVTLEGQVASNTSSSDIVIMKIQQLDSAGSPRTGSGFLYSVNRTIINVADFNTIVAQREGDLAKLRVALDEKLRLGMDTAAVETKYTSAQTAINNAKAAISAKSFTSAQTHLTSAQTLITQANTDLDKAWSQFEINQATEKVNEVNGMITYFKVNRSMGGDARVVEIVSKYESAGQTLSSAKTMFDQGNYAQSRILANESGMKAQEAYTLATDLKGQIGEGFSFGGIYLYLGIFVLAIMAIGGFVFYKKRFKWDELG